MDRASRWRCAFASGDAVALLGNALDVSLADELVQHLDDGGGPRGGALADFTLGEGRCGFAEGRAHARRVPRRHR